MSDRTWHEDDEHVLRLARRAERDRPGPPAMAGYESLVELARGGQGVVYRAVQQRTGATVAIKVLGRRLDRARRRFEREIEIIAGLRHPNIVRVLDSGVTADGQLYLVMEYLDGVSLDHLLARRSADAADDDAGDDSGACRTIESALAMFVKICDAVHYAHCRGVLHRDLKPGNIIIAGGEPHVLDFGVARVVDGGLERLRSDSITGSGEFLGSLPWASPELLSGGDENVDLRSDVYALGVILFQLLTGKFPYEVGGALREVVETIVTAEPARPGAVRAELDEDLDTIVLRCLAKRPSDRYQSAGELARDVSRYLAGEPIEARREHALARMRNTVSRYRQAIVIASAAAIGLLVTSVTVSMLLGRAVTAERSALEQRDESVRQRRTAEASMGFLVRMIESADPVRDGGPLDPGLRRMLNSAGTRLESELAGQPLVQAEVARSLGRTCYQLGMLEEAVTLIDKAITVYETAGQLPAQYGGRAERIALADCLKTRGLAHHAAGRFPEAVQSLGRSLAIMKKEIGPGMDWTIATAIDLAAAHAAGGEYDEAARLLTETLAALGPPESVCSHVIGVARARLAELAQVMGRPEEAQRSYQQAADELRARLGPNGLELADCLERFATLRIEQGRGAEAVELASESLAIYRSRLSADHWRIGLCLTTLGDARLLVDDGPAGREVLEDGARILRATLGERHPFTVRAVNLLAKSAEGDRGESHVGWDE